MCIESLDNTINNTPQYCHNTALVQYQYQYHSVVKLQYPYNAQNGIWYCIPRARNVSRHCIAGIYCDLTLYPQLTAYWPKYNAKSQFRGQIQCQNIGAQKERIHTQPTQKQEEKPFKYLKTLLKSTNFAHAHICTASRAPSYTKSVGWHYLQSKSCPDVVARVTRMMRFLFNLWLQSALRDLSGAHSIWSYNADPWDETSDSSMSNLLRFTSLCHLINVFNWKWLKDHLRPRCDSDTQLLNHFADSNQAAF